MLKSKTQTVFSNIVEADETYVGGKESNKHKDKRLEGTQGRSTKTKTAMFGLLERGKGVQAQKVENSKKKTLQTIINEKVSKDATIVTDEWVAYKGLSKNFTHLTVNHSVGEYVNGIAHTNSLESFWALFKRGLTGIYHWVSEKHIDRYLTEFSTRYNTRKCSESERFNYVLSQCNGRLKYKTLIANPKNIHKNLSKNVAISKKDVNLPF